MSAIAFRRINGRIVPIKGVNKKTVAKGAAEITAGAAVAVGSGVAVAKAVRAATSMVVKGRTKFRVSNALAKTATGVALTTLKSSAREGAKLAATGKSLYRLRSPLLSVATIASGALLSSGYEHVSAGLNKKPEKIGPFKFITGAGVAGALAATSYYKTLPVKGAAKIAANVYAQLRGKPSPFKADWWKK